MKPLDRIHVDPAIMAGRACVKGTRITVTTLLGLLAEGQSIERVLELYPDISEADVRQAIAYGALLSQEQELALTDLS
ncbi:MAG TPA: DUF433 domain-containing protein [Fimbriimonadaceae bacterium]|mgnify:CR=1 FL=1|nr:DUF433 domain-containing protein [Fimbriimonadaceae bacterium]